MTTFKSREKFVPPLKSALMKPQDEKQQPRVRTSDPEELAGVWKDFLTAKFTPTELEKTRSALDELPESGDETRQ